MVVRAGYRPPMQPPLFGPPTDADASRTAVERVPGATVEVRRSARRRKTVSAYRDGDRIVVLLPARMSRAQERHWVEVMTARLAAREGRSRPSDEALMARARQLSQRYLHGGARPVSVRWVGNQSGRWGSCTIEDRTIRLSTRLQAMPVYVVDYVLLHELAHLIVPEHGPDFWALLEPYPRTERARGFLDGWAAAAAGAPGGSPQDPQPPDEEELDGAAACGRTG